MENKRGRKNYKLHDEVDQAIESKPEPEFDGELFKMKIKHINEYNRLWGRKNEPK